MKTVRNIVICLLVVCFVGLSGCGKKADETKPISEVKTEAEGMSVEKLKSTAMAYKEALVAKKADVEKLMTKLKDVPVAKLMGEEAKGLKGEVDDLGKSISALKARFQVYYDKLKEKGGDLSGLEI